MQTAPRACPSQSPPEEPPPVDPRLRVLLLSVRQAGIIVIRAIEAYLGIGPARSER